MNIVRHLIWLSSAGFLAGWAMVQIGLATIPLLAGAIVAAALVSLYLVLSLLLRLARPFRANLQSYSAPNSLLGFDSRGDLKIKSDYPNRD